MTLLDQVSKLKHTAALADRIASHWQKQIAEHGETKAEAFYHHIHGHELKAVEWEGLTLSRQPTDAEKICVKSIHAAQETGKKKVAKVLGKVSAVLFGQALESIAKLKPSEYHTLVLKLPKTAKPDVVAQLEEIYLLGRKQVAKEIATALGTAEEAVTATAPKAIEALAETVLSGVANDVTARVASVATRAVTVGLDGAQLRDRIQKDIEALSDAPVQRASAGAANRGFGMGRRDEAKDEKPDGLTWSFSAILDQNTCGPCDDEDGTEYESYDDAPEVPYAECEGGSLCRCFIVGVAAGG